MTPIYISIQQEETGRNIRRLMQSRGICVRDVQDACGFEQPQAVYKWLSGKSLPSIDNLLILSVLLHTTLEGILVTSGDALLPFCGQQEAAEYVAVYILSCIFNYKYNFEIPGI